MAETKKRFWSGLFRTKSNAQGGRLFKEQPRRASEGDVSYNRRRTHEPEITSTRRRPRRAPPRDDKGKGRADSNGRLYDSSPLSEWPPSGVSSEEELSLRHATELISRGAPAHKGHKRPIPYRSEQFFTLYATTAGGAEDETDAADQHDSMTQLTTFWILRKGTSKFPWDTLEQPSLAFRFGARPGTITLNHWSSLGGMIPPALELRDPGIKPREVDLVQIFERLLELERDLENENRDLLYRNLYRRFLKDPEKLFNPHKAMDKQITDLIMVLSSPDWTDFTIPKNQVATRFIYDTSHSNHEQYHKFFHQLLLSLELEIRISAGFQDNLEKEKVLAQMPPKIQWNLCLARRWREYIRIEEFGETADKVRLRFKMRKRQAKMLKRFAQMMKWPNLDEALDALKQNEVEGNLLGLSSHTMAFFSGLVLPGPTFPFLLMNTLVDIDPDEATDHLALLTHLHPHCGFQYRKSHTYWSSTCIVGKVLAPTCHEVGGWVGPARPTVDLESSQIARIRSRRPKLRITPEDVTSMSERSDPLGPPAEVFPVSEYSLVIPDADDFVDTVRIELLGLKSTMPARQDHGPEWFDASIRFAIDGVSWPLRLNYDVSFVNAWPCSAGPHPLFFDYVYTKTKVDMLVNIRDWGNPSGLTEGSVNSTPVGGSKPMNSHLEDDDAERVLVVEAFGVPDNEVLARAWCSHWGLSAVVADIRKCCMACAIREAYAATLTVVILVEDQPTDYD